MKLTPLHDRIIVKPALAEEVTKGGIIIPDTAKEKPLQGKITAVGKGKIDDSGKLIPIQLKVGDNVLYGKYAGTEITIEGEEYLIMKENDVFAIVE
ncbi:MAG: co-chaperone GroES [Bacteroidetes bacterium]|nr:co-chaperone GroES [Bacteroidota bacterium]